MSEPNEVRRVDWVDIARGMGILLVVYGHALRGIYDGRTLAQGWQDGLIYAFHMPLFFLLSGLFVERGLARGRGPFLRDKLATVAYPYFLWSLVSGVANLLTSQWVNTPVPLMGIALIPIRPIEQYWFLYVLFVDQLILSLLFPRRWLIAVAGVIGVAIGLLFGGGNILARSMMELPYMVAGLFCVAALTRAAGGPVAWQAAMGIAAWLLFLLLHFAPPEAFHGLADYGAALAGTFGTILAAMIVARAGLGRVLALLGRASMAIYVTHTLASAGLRILLMQTGLTRDPTILLILCTAAGIVVPLIIWEAARRLALCALLGFGRDRRPPPPRLAATAAG